MRWFAGLAGGLTLAALMLYWLVPPTRRMLYRENQGVEWVTAALFLAAAVVGTRRLWTIGAGWRDPRWLNPRLSFVAMLDEVGWVVFALGVKPPIILGRRVDAVHDFAEIGVTLVRLYPPQWAVVLIGAVFAGAVLRLLATAARWWRGLIGSPSWRFFMIAASFGVASQILDIDLARDDFLKTLEVVFELDGSLALVFSASLLRSRPKGWPHGMRSRPSVDQNVVAAFWISRYMAHGSPPCFRREVHSSTSFRRFWIVSGRRPGSVKDCFAISIICSTPYLHRPAWLAGSGPDSASWHHAKGDETNDATNTSGQMPWRSPPSVGG